MEAISFRPPGTSKAVPDERHPGRDLLEAPARTLDVHFFLFFFEDFAGFATGAAGGATAGSG